MADSSSPVDTSPGDVASSRYAGAAQVLGYDQKQADWVAGHEELVRAREARARRRKRLILAGRITAWLAVIAVVLGLLIAGVSWLANVSHEANERAKAEASISASMSPSPTPSSTPSPSPTSASPKPSPTPTEKCLTHEERVNTIDGSPESEYCKNQERISRTKGMLQAVIPLICVLLLVLVMIRGFQTGNLTETLIIFIVTLIAGVLFMVATNVLL
jgi:hypothetical protein